MSCFSMMRSVAVVLILYPDRFMKEQWHNCRLETMVHIQAGINETVLQQSLHLY